MYNHEKKQGLDMNKEKSEGETYVLLLFMTYLLPLSRESNCSTDLDKK